MLKHLVAFLFIAMSIAGCIQPSQPTVNGPQSIIIYPPDSAVLMDTTKIVCVSENAGTAVNATFYLNGNSIGSSATQPFSMLFDPYYFVSKDKAVTFCRLSIKVTDGAGQTGPLSSITVGIPDFIDKCRSLIKPVYKDSLRASSTVQFAWRSIQNTARYFIQVSADYQAQTIIMSDSTDSTGINLVFSEPGSYYWRLRGKSTTGVYGDWSTPQSFYFGGPIPPRLLSSPLYSNSESCRIVASSSIGATKYEYLLSHDTAVNGAAFSDTVFHEVSSDTAIDCGLLAEGPYYLQIRAANGSGIYGAWTSRYGIGINVYTRIIPTTASISIVKSILYANNGIAIVACDYTSTSPSKSYLVLLDSNGVLRRIDDLQNSTVYSAYPLSITTTLDSGFVFSLSTRDRDSALHLTNLTHIVGYGSNGIRAFDKTFSGSRSFVTQLSSGDFLTTWDNVTTGVNIEKYDPDFTLIWKHNYSNLSLRKIWQSSNTNVHLIAEYASLGTIYHLQIDTNGSQLSSNTFDDGSFFISSIIVEPDGGMACIGSGNSYGSFIRFDPSGKTILKTSLSDSLIFGTSLYHTNDGNFLSSNGAYNKPVHNCVISPAGQIISSTTIAAPEGYQLREVLQQGSGHLILIGTQSNFGQPSQLVVMKTDKNGNGLNLNSQGF